MDGLEFLREHPKLNTKPIRRSRLHEAANDLCGCVSERLRVDEEGKVVCHAPWFRPKQFFGAFVSFYSDFGLLAPLRLWPRRFQKKGYPWLSIVRFLVFWMFVNGCRWLKLCGSFAKATRSSRVKSGYRSSSSLDFQFFFFAGDCGESSTTDDLKWSHKVFVAAIRQLSLVLVLSPDY